jgi:4-alpha-glucanotransferase
MQDLLSLGTKARMNTPSTVSGNWQWRALESDFNPNIAEKLREWTTLYGR